MLATLRCFDKLVSVGITEFIASDPWASQDPWSQSISRVLDPVASRECERHIRTLSRRNSEVSTIIESIDSVTVEMASNGMEVSELSELKSTHDRLRDLGSDVFKVPGTLGSGLRSSREPWFTIYLVDVAFIGMCRSSDIETTICVVFRFV